MEKRGEDHYRRRGKEENVESKRRLDQVSNEARIRKKLES